MAYSVARKGVMMSSMAALSLMLTACGGGGMSGGGSAGGPQPNIPPPPPPPPPPSPTPSPTPPPTSGVDFDTSEYRRSTANVSAGAIAAYESGASGKDVAIAIIDTGINPNLAAFSGRISNHSDDVAGNRGVSDQDGHGTAVAAVAAAARDDAETMGIAFDATIVSLRADDPGSCGSGDGCSLYDDKIAAGIDRAVAAGARVINLSLGGGKPSQRFVDAVDRAAAAGVVVVISAGNDGARAENGNPNQFASVPAARNAGMVIIAGAVGFVSGSGVDDSRMAEFSQLAGNSAAHYLTALGSRVQAPDHNGKQYLWSGTSFAAPVISGAVALLADAFPNLTGREIVEILFDSADDLGAKGIDDVFGNGRLNIERAFMPSGQTSLAGTRGAVSLTGNGTLPAAAGDAANGAGQTTLVTDKYDRAYRFSPVATLDEAESATPLAALSGLTRSGGAANGPIAVSLTVAPVSGSVMPSGGAVDMRALHLDEAEEAEVRLLAGHVVARIGDDGAVAMGFSEGLDAMVRRLDDKADAFFLAARPSETGFDAGERQSLALRRNVAGFGVTAGAESGSVRVGPAAFDDEQATYRRFALGIDRQLGLGIEAGATITTLSESDTLLGGRIDPMWGGSGATTRFLDLEARKDFAAGWSVAGTMRRGWTDFDGGALETGAFDLTLAKQGVATPTDRIAFRVAQPLRVEAGGLDLYVPVAWDYATESATWGWQQFSFTPSGRELVGEVSYAKGLFGGHLGVNAYVRRQPGHIATNDTDVGAAVRFSKGF